MYGGIYIYDAHGNMIQMPHLQGMEWDFKDQLRATQKQAVSDGNSAEKTYYVYDSAGQRVRKVTERANETPKDERIYLGGFEIYRAYNGDGSSLKLERETLHVMDGEKRIALVETQTVKEENGVSRKIDSPKPIILYQLGNHLGSASLELDEIGNVISYEEYYPYGSTSYQGGRNVAEVSLKRYRYTGKERDEESGLYYHGARYYAAWLGRWISCDPIRIGKNTDLYVFVDNSPIYLLDPSGLQGESAAWRAASTACTIASRAPPTPWS
jgi:RHS repeat-associated protein